MCYVQINLKICKRIPFLFGIFLFIPGFYLKTHEELPEETEEYLEGSTNGKENINKNPIKEAFRKENRRMLLSAILVGPVITSLCLL